MTHTPPESKAWPNAGAADRPSASGEQFQSQSQGQPASDLPAAAGDEQIEEMAPPFPEAGRHEGDTPEREAGRREAKDSERLRRDADEAGRATGSGSDSERI
jgi:hypothetical protein